MESTGIHPYKHSLLSLGAVDFDNPTNHFYMECRMWDGAHVDPKALEINGFSEQDLVDPAKKTDKELVEAFLEWTKTCKDQTFAGQNPSIDRDFLKVTAERYHLNWPFAQRTIDLHSVAYVHMMNRGITPPIKNAHSGLNLPKILEYVGLPDQAEPHNGLTDAKLEAESLCRLIYGKNLLPEYASFPVPRLS